MLTLSTNFTKRITLNGGLADQAYWRPCFQVKNMNFQWASYLHNKVGWCSAQQGWAGALHNRDGPVLCITGWVGGLHIRAG